MLSVEEYNKLISWFDQIVLAVGLIASLGAPAAVYAYIKSQYENGVSRRVLAKASKRS